MFDFAWSEIALIAVVALVVIGPKDLPRVLRTVGIWTRKARAVAREFQGSLEQMVREAELEDVKRDIDKATRFDFEKEMARSIDPQGEIERSLNDPALANPLADAPKPVESATPPASEAALPPPAAEAPAEEAKDTHREEPAPARIGTDKA